MKSIVGAIFPISLEHFERVFDQGRTAFLKYTKFKRLENNAKIIFYVSKKKMLLGQGTIEDMAILDPKLLGLASTKRSF